MKVTRSHPAFLALLATCIAWSGCVSLPSEPLPSVDARSTFVAIQREILTPGCATSGCHSGGEPAGGLSLEPTDAYEQLVGAPASGFAAARDHLLRVRPGEPGSSFLMTKIAGVPGAGYGDRMPLGSSALDSGRIEFIREWIEAGAPRTGVVADTTFLHSGHGPGSFTPLPLPAEGFQLRIPPYTIRPHSEREVFIARYGPVMPESYITKIHVKMTEHSHHFTLYSFAPDDPHLPVEERLRDRGRNMDEFLYTRQFVFGSQEADVTYELPPGVGLPTHSHTLFDLNMHAVNDGTDTISAAAYVNLHTTAHVEKIARPLLWSYTGFRLRPHAATVVRDTFAVTHPIDLCMLTSHFHRHGVSFRMYAIESTGAAQQIYQNTSWDHPTIESFAPRIHLDAGENLALEATYFNDTDHDIYYGPGAEDEMCSVFGLYVDGE